jgi:acid phosphatase type 7
VRFSALLAALAAALAVPASGSVTARSATLIAAGDVAACDSRGDEQTGKLVRRLHGTVAVLGDAVYERGTDAEFRRCYAPTWGPVRPRTRPAVGNHEYGTPDAAGYFRYFGRAAGPAGKGWYSYRLGTWHVVVLNTNCSIVGCDRGSEQYRWLAADLARHKARCTIAYGHHPRLSSGFHGPDPTVVPLWRLLYAHGADVALAGHDHHYERFAPIDPAGRIDQRRGIRSFVVGTGGKTPYPILRHLVASRVHHAGVYGVLVLRLLPGRYTWRFVSVPGGDFRDAGDARCH